MSKSNMPKPNEALKAYFSDNEKFADLFNVYAFGKELEELFYAMNYIYSRKDAKENRVISNSTLSLAGILSGSRALYTQPKGGKGDKCYKLMLNLR